MSDVTHTPTLERLEWSIRALAQSADKQMELFPEFVCVADELALDFDEHYQRFLAEGFGDLESEARQKLAALDEYLSSFSGPDNAELWTDEALGKAPEWRKTRELAKDVIARMGWSSQPPPKDRAIYVGSDA
jgi:hypothetical protein